MQKARDRTFTRRCIVLSRLVDTRFQGLFTPLAGVLFAFPSRYWFAIGRQVVFSLGRWSSQLPTGLLEHRGTQVPASVLLRFAYAGVLSASPSRYLFYIVHKIVFSLERLSSQLPTGLLEPRGTQVPARVLLRFAYATVTRFGRPFQAFRLRIRNPMSPALQPPRSS